MPGLDETSLLTYQKFDGSNTTMLLRSFGTQISKKTTLTGGFGGSTNFHGNNAFILEGKAKHNFNEHFSVQARSRNAFSERESYSQVRISPEYKTKISDNVSFYANPYAAAKYSYQGRKLSSDVGIFSGVTYQSTPEYKVSFEVQKYNGLKGGAENFGFNVILSHCF